MILIHLNTIQKVVLYGIMLSFLLLILITNITNLMSYPVNNIMNCSSTYEVDTATYIIFILMRFCIPFGVMLTLNLVIIIRLKQSKRASNLVQIASTQHVNGSRQMTNKQFRFTVSTIFIDMVFLFFYLPLGVNLGIASYFHYVNPLTSDNVFNVFSFSTQMLALFHSSVLIFLFIAFNKCFREEFILLFRLNYIF